LINKKYIKSNSISGLISAIRWGFFGDQSGNYALFIRGNSFNGKPGDKIIISGTATTLDGIHTVIETYNDNSFNDIGTRIMISKDEANSNISSTLTGNWALVS
jgi:hypothetical protein